MPFGICPNSSRLEMFYRPLQLSIVSVSKGNPFNFIHSSSLIRRNHGTNSWKKSDGINAMRSQFIWEQKPPNWKQGKLSLKPRNAIAIETRGETAEKSYLSYFYLYRVGLPQSLLPPPQNAASVTSTLYENGCISHRDKHRRQFS